MRAKLEKKKLKYQGNGNMNPEKFGIGAALVSVGVLYGTFMTEVVSPHASTVVAVLLLVVAGFFIDIDLIRSIIGSNK